ncbi:MAG: ABC transporter substrate-binding protein [Rikenellaceae bacterium]|nr:ABC transporter substrate-binding protein [Rikenellaceae bacterium]MCL2693028.1 ABC transporter substrate-binding protein [Rikenellaceae bacterium]
MRKFVTYVLLTAFAALAGGCEGGRRMRLMETGELSAIYIPRHASGFAIYGIGQRSSLLSVLNPWQGALDVEMQLFLSRGGEMPPEGFSGTVVNVPLKKVICMSSSHIAMLDELGETRAIKGVSGGRYVTNPLIVERFESGYVREVGYDALVNYELIAALEPDLVMIYGISGGNSRMTHKLDELGIKYIYIGDYVEHSPLGKAEWIVAFGEMFDKRDQAVNVFSNIEERYNEVHASVVAHLAGRDWEDRRPVVMLNAPYRDTWYVPGDRNYMARLLADAGAQYASAGVDSYASRPISGESAYRYAVLSDFWLNPGQAETLDDVRSLNPKFADIPAVVNGRVYNCNARTTPGGGSDFWESGAMRPDLVLMDMARIFHPQLLPDHELFYFRRLE